MIRLASLLPIFALAASAADWSPPAEVRHEYALCVAYQARFDGPYLVVRATVGQGWHTFALDNQRRAEEKLAGQPALSVDRATEIKPLSGAAVSGPWFQSAPKDFSRPELRMFTWGFDHEATFAAKAARNGGGPVKLSIKGQACTATVCKNIDVTLTVPAAAKAASPQLDLKSLVEAR